MNLDPTRVQTKSASQAHARLVWATYCQQHSAAALERGQGRVGGEALLECHTQNTPPHDITGRCSSVFREGWVRAPKNFSCVSPPKTSYGGVFRTLQLCACRGFFMPAARKIPIRQNRHRFLRTRKAVSKGVDRAHCSTSVSPLTLSAPFPVSIPVPLELVVRGDGRREPALLQL